MSTENMDSTQEFDLMKFIQDKSVEKLSQAEFDYIYNMGAKKFEIGDFKNAIPFFQFLMLAKPNEPLYFKSCASCCQQLENYPEAYLYYQSAFLKDMEKNQDCLFYMGFCAMKMKIHKESIDFFNQFLKNNPGHALEKKAKLFLKGLEKKVK